jgi:hypothetical protein
MGELQSQQRAGAEKEAEPVSHTDCWCWLARCGAREREEKHAKWARVPWCEPTEGFCSSVDSAWPSDWNERMSLFVPRRGPGGRESFSVQAHDEAWCAGSTVARVGHGPNSHSGLRHARVGRGPVMFSGLFFDVWTVRKLIFLYVLSIVLICKEISS